MEDNSNGQLERTSSQASTASTKSHKSGTVRVKPRRYMSNNSTTQTPPSDKSLTSFPSLSPDDSLKTIRARTPKQKTPAEPAVQTPQQPRKHTPSIVERLTTSTPSFRGRPALFDDSSAKAQDIPGALHHASDEHIERLIARTGAVALVRQMAADLAQRDAQVITLRQRAEERERELKRMLREVEVSNLDIETRLHNLETSIRNSSLDDVKGAAGCPGERRTSGARSSTSASNTINEMVNEAMAEYVSIELELDEGYLDSVDERDRQATIRPGDAPSISNDERRSIKPGVAGNGRGGYTSTSYKASRSSSILSGVNEGPDMVKPRVSSSGLSQRTSLNSDMFQPPEDGSSLSRRKTMDLQNSNEVQDGNDSDNQSRKSSFSVTSWTLKLFAGNQAGAREGDRQKHGRGRAATMGGDVAKRSRIASLASVETGSSAKAALMKVSKKSSNTTANRSSATSLNVNANGTIKAAGQEGWRNIASSILPPGSPMTDTSADGATNLGPVEMDTIVPPDSRPPTSTHTYNDSRQTEFLTDRFGFIYDQRRKTRQWSVSENIGHRRSASGVEMLTGTRDVANVIADSNKPEPTKVVVGSPVSTDLRPDTPASVEEMVDEKPTMKWQDYLKVANYPTELLSHTPSAAAITTLTNVDAVTTPEHRSSLPLPSLNAQSSIATGTVLPAEPTVPSTSTGAISKSAAKGEHEPVRTLLEQLTELHDSLQREKTIKWNEFLRKVRADRRREGEAAVHDGRLTQASMPEVSLTDGEMIGVAGLGNKGKVGRAKWNEFKSLVLGGIPVAYRAKIWAECSGASALRAPGYYEDLVNNGVAVDDPAIVAQIQMDINRTLTDNVFFRRGPGVAKLNEVLLAYSRRNPSVGYCQGMNLIAASLLLIMPTAEEAFWVLARMVESILPDHYYDHSLLASRADQHVLRQYVAELLPTLSAHLDALGIELEALTFQWFLSVFTDCLSAEALFRVWDVVLCTNDGSTFLFQVALALLKLNEKSLLRCEAPAEVYGYINHEMTNHAIGIDGLINASDALKKVVRRMDVEERRAKAVEEEREVMRVREVARGERRVTRVATDEAAAPDGDGIDRSRRNSDSLANDGEENSMGELHVYSPMPVDEEILKL